MRQRTILTALLYHTRRLGEPLTQFREQIRALSDQDREWFARQFAQEFDYEIVEGAPLTTSPTQLALVPPPQPTPSWGYIEL